MAPIKIFPPSNEYELKALKQATDYFARPTLFARMTAKDRIRRMPFFGELPERLKSPETIKVRRPVPYSFSPEFKGDGIVPVETVSRAELISRFGIPDELLGFEDETAEGGYVYPCIRCGEPCPIVCEPHEWSPENHCCGRSERCLP